ncbi:TetR family transcriptional regulator [Nocardioides sp. TF02-7]|uniref:TetR family transcriptional regulator n=1 Tax=Nocardioides sp. TF02-7 TaxID=2917724 RepID=UPI001F065B20|nr:TetR family transcriptional regulator [Nocardioides sp. TF02-7]UMG94335.1 TetR/AcrR family transcriptional regulator [Nocardioides sp. TF02-7]
MPRPLIDLLWRDHPAAAVAGRRGPPARVSTGTVVGTAVRLADGHGLAAVTVRRLAAELEVSTMSVYTHVNSRDDLLVLMADAAHALAELPAYGRLGWRSRVRLVAEANLALPARAPVAARRGRRADGARPGHDREVRPRARGARTARPRRRDL